MRKYIIPSLLFLWSYQTINAQVSDLFGKKNGSFRNYNEIVRSYDALELNMERLKKIQTDATPDLLLSIPFENRQLNLELKKVSLTSKNFTVIEAKPDGSKHPVQYSDAVFYQGKIAGQPSSFATLSFVGDEVIGVFADNKSNIVLGAIQDNGLPTSDYTLYRDSELKIANPNNCFTEDEPADQHNNINIQNRLTTTGQPIDIYFECDYKFYQDKGSNTINVINYVLGFFNNVALIYENEDIKVQVSSILVWTTQDPEAAAGLNTTSTVLPAFAARMATTSYVGDFAHLLSTRSLGGGIAYVLSNICSSGKNVRTAVSAINNTYSNYPTYSWTVQVVTHELGHNFGSPHTHSCTWPGGPIDNCSAVDNGPCNPGPPPVNGGTIMSYCHLTSAGINFNNGFGTLPGNRIRSVVGVAACLGSCRMTIDITKLDASCNQNNGTATVTTLNSTGALTYLWSNGQTGATLVNAAPGTYHVTVTDASGCQVMEDVVIGNSGTALTFNLTPNGTAGYCSGGDLTLNATNNPAYTYVWRLNGNIINGVTSSSYTINSPGTYSVTATSGACSGTQSVVVSQIASPTAAIAPANPAPICTGSSVILNADIGGAYTYQWYNNGTPINGATNSTYTAVASGNYSVRVSAGNSCQATSSAVSVTVNPTPTATITAGGATSFCSGNSVVLTSSSGTGYTYQWYRNTVAINDATQSTYTVTTGGDYTVVTTLGTCSNTSAVRTVTVWPNPVIMVTPSVSTIQKFQTQVLTGSGAPNFDWQTQPGFVSSTATTVTLRPLTTTTYTIKGWDNNNCENTTTATINVIGCGDVTNITANHYSPSRVLLKWTNPQGVTTDTLQYRKTGTTSWNKIFVTGQEYELNNLEPNTDYEYNIIPLCTTTTVFIPSATNTFKTNQLENGLFLRLFPNPFSASPITRLEIVSASNFTLDVSIYDNNGKLITTVASGESHNAGQVIKQIHAEKLSSGIYYVVVGVNGKKENIRMAVVK